VTVERSQTELAHTPRLVGGSLQYLSAGSYGSLAERLNVVNPQIGNIAVIAEFRCRRDVRAATKHELDLATTTESPVAGIDFMNLTAKHVAIPPS
jgi:hypothetical protein